MFFIEKSLKNIKSVFTTMLQNTNRKSNAGNRTYWSVAETATKPSPVSLQNHSLDGCTIDKAVSALRTCSICTEAYRVIRCYAVVSLISWLSQ